MMNQFSIKAADIDELLSEDDPYDDLSKYETISKVFLFEMKNHLLLNSSTYRVNCNGKFL